jgi:DNA-binding CsgD family transcriptional regulator
MTSSAQPDPALDDHTIELIAARVADMLKTELETIVADLAAASSPGRPLTVGEVADRFGLGRSTVYTHWREWGGYKLGTGDKATIRFDQQALPERPPDPTQPRQPSAKNNGPRRKRQRPRRDLLRARPRFPRELDAEALTQTTPPDDQTSEQTGD